MIDGPQEIRFYGDLEPGLQSEGISVVIVEKRDLSSLLSETFLRVLRRSWLVSWVLLGMAAGVSSVWGHNGAFAFAVPVTSLTIDGDLSDWPSEVDRQLGTAVQHFDYPIGGEDGSFWFQVGYDAERAVLYLGFQVFDESRAPVIELSPEFQDRLGLFLDLENLEASQGKASSRNIYFHLRRDFSGWMDQIQRGWNSCDGVAEIKSRDAEGSWGMEMAISLKSLLQEEITLKPDTLVGLDVAFFDVDQDGTTSEYHWGSGIGKYERRAYGDLVLLGEGQSFVPFRGQISTDRFEKEPFSEFFVVESVEHPSWPELVVVSETEGRFDRLLPEGRYRVPSGELGEFQLDADSATTEFSFSLKEQRRQKVSVIGGSAQSVEAAEWRADGQWFVANLREVFSGILIQDLAVDSRSDLWIGSNWGWVKYDGFAYTRYQPMVDGGAITFSAVAVDGEGRVWGADRTRGLFVLEGESVYLISNPHGIFREINELMVDDQGMLWIAGFNGVARYKDGRFKLIDEIDHYRFAAAHSVAVSRQGSLWVAGPSNRMHRYFEGKLDQIDAWQQDRSVLSDTYGHLQVDQANRVFVNAAGGIVQSYADHPDIGSVVASSSPGVGEGITEFGWDGREFWSVGAGGYRFNQAGRVESFSDLGLRFSAVNQVAVDGEKVVWVGGEYDGLARYRNSNVRRLPLPENLEAFTCAEVLAEDWYLFGTESMGLVEYRAGNVTLHTYETTGHVLPNREITCIKLGSEGHWWVGSSSGLCRRRRDGTWENAAGYPAWPSFRIHDLEVDASGKLWVWGRDGLWQIADDSGEQVADLGVVFGITSDHRDQLWLVSSEGVRSYSDDLWSEFLPLPAGSSSSPRCLVVDEDAEGIWLGSESQGVFQLSASQPSAVRRHIGVGDGIVDVEVQSLLVGDDGELWIGSRNGLSRVLGDAVVTMDVRDGLPSNRVTDLTKLPGRGVMVTTTDGVILYESEPSNPKLQVEVVGSDRSEIPDGPWQILRGEPMTVTLRSYSPRTTPRQMNYRYRVVGYHDEWKTTRQRTIELRDLPVGDYELEVVAIDRDFNESREPERVPFTVVTPLSVRWQMAARGGGMLFVLIGVGVVGLRLRKRSLKRQALFEKTLAENRELARAKTLAEERVSVAEEVSQLKSEFLAALGSELQMPVESILSSSQLLAGETARSSGEAEAVHSLASSRSRLLAVTRIVRDLSLVEMNRLSLSMARFDLFEVLDELSEVFASECSRLGLAWEVRRPLDRFRYVHGDATRLRQVVWSLVNHALEATESGGVFVSVALVASGIPAENGSRRSRFRFDVKDTRVSPIDEQQANFRCLWKNLPEKKEAGSALGLILSEGLVRLMGGTISCEFGKEVGTTASFDIPLRIAPENESLAKSHRPSEAGEGSDEVEAGAPGALVVDDVSDNRFLLRILLENAGFAVEEADSGLVMLDRLSQCEVSIIFLDLRMPKLTGYETLALMRQESAFESIPVVAVSASASSRDKKLAEEAGFAGFISKPVNSREVREVLKSLLGVEIEEVEPTTDAKSSIQSSEQKQQAVDLGMISDEEREHLKLMISQYRRTEFKEALNQLSEKDARIEPLVSLCEEKLSAADWKGLAKIFEGEQRGS